MSASVYFSSNYNEARGKFLEACAKRSFDVESIPHPTAKGVAGEDLYTDVLRIGSPDASKCLLLTSGTHGVEGYCGSGVQVGLLNEGYFENLPDDTAVVMVHAVNPYGFSHDRRVNEDNVDLNRNYVDYDAITKLENVYCTIHPFIVPTDWDGPAKQKADEGIAKYIEEHGLRAFQATATGGQYHHPDGIFFGGAQRAWSWKMIKSVLTNHMEHAKLVGVIDVHTGLGPYGYGELITLGPPEQKKRAGAWYNNQVTDPDAGTSTSAPIIGTVGHGISDILSKASTVFIALEYGTFEIERVLQAIIADNWLYQHGEVDSDLGRAIKAEVRDAFYGDTDEWKLAVWERAFEVIDMALDGLKTSDA